MRIFSCRIGKQSIGSSEACRNLWKTQDEKFNEHMLQLNRRKDKFKQQKVGSTSMMILVLIST